MSERKSVTREYRPRYKSAGKKEKTRLLNEFTELTGYHRKQAIRVLNQKPPQETLVYVDGKAVKLKPEKKRRPANRKGHRIYTDDVIAALRLVWEFFWHKCGKIFAPLLRQQMEYIAAIPSFGITPEIEAKLLKISPARIDHYLKADKAALRLTGKSLTKSLPGLKSRIPIRTFYTDKERKTPGYLQIDTVHHCGQFTGGQYNLTLTATDVYSGWINLYALLNKAHQWTFAALKDIKDTLPFPLLEFHSDNGSEFINHATEKWCNDPAHPIPFTHSRDHKKNDNAFVEQKNGAVVREYIGYNRLETKDTRKSIETVYRSLVPLLNFFMPTTKLASKTRVGSKEIRKYDKPRSPYQRLMESETLSQEVKDRLTSQAALYNPVKLQQTVNKAVIALMNKSSTLQTEDSL